jgi:hypothetical protein
MVERLVGEWWSLPLTVSVWLVEKDSGGVGELGI